ncbi:hypothetical protein [Streptomyces justiciae]|uniref:hypothetical protein n=1 Tax=Streptomyces justiciae TaxID=2780140 RepID=UPI0021192C50|nr:hypothetical protein [Streptomyces justiciae]MCW8381986.1 hypothetical protein [Streptomyces justiciae]
METRPLSPQPSGEPRWVAMFRRPSTDSWRVAAESPHRGPVLYAVGEMSQTLRARGEEVSVEVWGPGEGGGWQTPARDDSAASAAVPEASVTAVGAVGAPDKLVERMQDRRHQVLMAGLSKAGRYDLAPEDVAAVQALVDRLDETTLRTVAGWFAGAAGGH